VPGRLGIPCRAEENEELVAFRVDSLVEIHPGVLDLDGRLIHSPGIVTGVEVRPTAFFEIWSLALHESGKW
jgi:hypothetical protein